MLRSGFEKSGHFSLGKITQRSVNFLGLIIILPGIIAGMQSCKEKPDVPTLVTTLAVGITRTTALTGGTISGDGGAEVTSRGVCWSSNTNPVVTSFKTEDGPGTGNFSSIITGLTPATKYYVRSYATNSSGTGYGNEISFTTNSISIASISTTVISYTTDLANIEGTVNDDGGSQITASGVCWAVSQNPGIDGNHTSDAPVSGLITSSLTGLNPNSTYYARAYATTSVGTAYGNQASFTTLTSGTISDIDQNIYKIAVIGTQTWMTENLKTKRYLNGDSIKSTYPAAYTDISAEIKPGYQWIYNGEGNQLSTYGRLYTWYSATDSRNICPEGWHVPSDHEWNVLEEFLGGWYEVAGSKMKEKGTSHWSSFDNSVTNSVTNSSYFTGLPGGMRSYSMDFEDLGNYGYWWSSTEDTDPNLALGRSLEYLSNSIYTPVWQRLLGFSIRCLKD